MATQTLRLRPTDFGWNRPPGPNPFPWNRAPNPGLGQNCMDFDTYMEQCSGGGTSVCGDTPATEQPCIEAMAAQVTACQAAWTSTPGNCHEPGTEVSYAGGTVTETSPTGQIATANANTVPETAYGQNAQGVEVYTNEATGVATPISTPTQFQPAPIVVSSSAPPSTQPPAITQPSGTVPPPSGTSSTSSSTPAGSTSPCSFALFGEQTCTTIAGMTIGTTTLLALGGIAAVLLFMMTGKR